ncbi:MAG: hypothetical protein O2999_13415 [Nitrospirae bacterium]|nr:hypothetical protein [Nitrospirota bacterium]MDA1305271.1 hypothetical protein [Nitrospirota bacterium]
MSKTEAVSLPHVGTIQLVIQSKRDIRAHEKAEDMDAESNEWFYWNRVWASEVALSEFLIQEFYPESLKGKTILELGCGTGLAGLVAGKLGGVPTFSDKVPLVMESTQEACRLNGIKTFSTLVLDWATPKGLTQQYDMVLGSEIFYDNMFLDDICRLLDHVLPVGGTGLFCDPNRLGLEAVEASFSKKFMLTTKDLEIEWPRTRSGNVKKKSVLLYQLVKK